MKNLKIAFIGAGNMATSIIGGLLAKGMSPKSIIASDPYPESLSRLSTTTSIKTTTDNEEAVSNADIVVLAVKPQVMRPVLESLKITIHIRKPLIISIAAGIECNSISKWLGGNDIPVVRCMPNTPALVQTGATALYANHLVSDEQRDKANNILRAVGIVLWVDKESDIDAVTAVSGSGPAYFFFVIEAMQTAAEQLGLSPELAKQLTTQTALGAAQMAITSDVDAAELRRRVTSPNGTTFEAIKVFEEGGLQELFTKAMTACRDRSKSLATEMDKK